jgi:hypothetical protein
MRKTFLQLHLAVFLAGFTAVLGRLIGLHEGWLVWYRLLLTFLIFAVYLLIRRELVRIPLRDMFRIFFIGLLLAFHWLAFYGSVKYSNASVAMVCLGSTGFFTAVSEPILFRGRWVWQELLFGLISLAGIYIIFDFNPQYKTGILFGMAAVLGSAVFPVLNKKMLNHYPHPTIMFYETLGAFISLSIALPFYLNVFPASHWMPTFYDFLWLLFLVIFCTLFAMDLQFRALKQISAFTVNLTYSMEPAYGILLAFIFLEEGRFFGPSFYWGLGLVMLSVFLHTLRVFRARRVSRD